MLAILSFQILCGLVSPIVGGFMDRFAMRWLVVVGAVSMSTGLALLSMATEFWQVILVYILFLPPGMLLTGTLASQTMVSKWFTEKRGVAIGLSAMGTSLGGLTIPLITTALIDAYAWQGALMILAVVSIMVPLNFLILRHEPPAPASEEHADSHPTQTVWTSRQILTSVAFWIPIVSLIPMNAAFGGVQFNLGAYMQDLGYEQSVAAQLISVTAFTMIIGKMFFGALGDRVDHRWLFWTMAVLVFFSMGLFEGEPTITELIIASVMMGFAVGGVMPMMGIAYSSRFGTVSFGKILGYVNLFMMIGSFGSILSGWVFDLTGSYDYAFWVFAAMVLPGAVATWFLPPVDTADPDPELIEATSS